MPIRKSILKEMNDHLKQGKTIADLAKQYPQYDYWEIYWEVDDYSFLGKKRMITNRLKKIRDENNISKRNELIDEIEDLLSQLYDRLKRNSKKLIEIDRILRKD
jgi:molybdopterin converting factor small subunit